MESILLKSFCTSSIFTFSGLLFKHCNFYLKWSFSALSATGLKKSIRNVCIVVPQHHPGLPEERGLAAEEA